MAGFDPSGGGKIINNPLFPNARILNASNIGHDAGKMLAMPFGWVQTDGYTETFARDQTDAVAFFRGPWGTRDLFYDWCLGHAITVLLPGSPQVGPFDQPGQLVTAILTAGGFGKLINNAPASPGTPFLSRNPPAQHWRFPWMYAVSCELMRGDGVYGPDPQGCLYDNFGNPLADANGNIIPAPTSIAYSDAATGSDSLSALVKVTYRSTEGLYEIRSDSEMVSMAGGKGELERWVTRKVNPSVQFLPLTGNTVKFYEGPLPQQQIPEVAKGLLLFVAEWEYTWVAVPDPPWDAIKACTGKVNSQPFDGARGGWPTFDPETLLCQAPHPTRHRSPVGRVTWDINYRFLHRPTGWNKFPITAPDGMVSGFYGASFDGTATGPRPYGSADLNTLFQPPAPQQYQ